MAPSITSPRTVMKSPKEKEAGMKKEETKQEMKQELAGKASSPKEIVATTDQKNAEAFRSDLNGVRILVTCTICDQLLYEPWTLACGHTYCYSCLCSWFLPNKRKKTCPDCRSRVKQLPAPAFLVKQMVEIFVNRAELMLADETTEQHLQRQMEENNIVEADKESESGIFKGCFSHQQQMGTLVFNEEDRLYRCARCGHEYAGGVICEVCELEFDPDDAGVTPDDLIDRSSLVSMDSLEMYDMEHDLDGGDSDLDFSDEEDADAFFNSGNLAHPTNVNTPLQSGAWPLDPDFRRVPHPLSQVHNAQNGEWGSSRSSRSGDDDDDEDDEDEGSLRDFIEHDDGPQHQHADRSHISINSVSPSPTSDSEEDEDGPIRGAVSTARRQARNAWSSARRRFVPESTASADTSDAGEADDEQARTFHGSGWSPLDNGAESEYGEHEPMMPNLVHGGSTDQYGENSDNDTDTIGGRQSEDDDVEDGGVGSRNLHWRTSTTYHNHDGHGSPLSLDRESTLAYDSDIGGSSVDREGDIEMSVSPTESSNVSVSSHNTDNTQRGREGSAEYLGTANAVHSVDDDDDDETDDSIVRAGLRRPRRGSQRSFKPDYNPRISRMFAQHQSDLRDATQRESPYFEDPHPELVQETATFMAVAQRASQARRPTVLQYSAPRAPMPSIMHPTSGPVILPSSSTRPNRVQRQYYRR